MLLPLSAPIYFSLELTSACNNQCPVCSNVFERAPTPLPASDWQKIIETIAPHAEVLKLTGGEPTLHPEFKEIISAIEERGIPFTLFTNARWYKPQAVIDLLRSVSQCQGLLISLHGHNAKTHEGFTRTSHSFTETCKNIQRATSAGLAVHTSTVITRYNWDRLNEVANLSQELGARRAVFNRYLGPVMPDIEPDEKQLRKAVFDIESMMQAASNVRYGSCIPQCFLPSSSTGCWAGVAYCTIDPWGNMRPCNHSPTIAGNVLEIPIEELWSGEVMSNWRALIAEQCNNCDEVDTCRGGCRALIEIRDRDPLVQLPIQEKRSQLPIKLKLYNKDSPYLVCKVQQESFGYALIRGHNIIPVTIQAKSILHELDGSTTLQQIYDEFGQDALDFVGKLYHQGFLELS
ncbi:MAG: radical SAM protein [Candidatus Electrothrix communis]|nr:MAG: radical SAM protein [Candidatus Electrothrix communis]